MARNATIANPRLRRPAAERHFRSAEMPGSEPRESEPIWKALETRRLSGSEDRFCVG